MRMPGEYGKQLARYYGLNRYFTVPQLCWIIGNDQEPKQVTITRIRPADNGNDASWADTTEGNSVPTFYLWPGDCDRPFLAEMTDEYGTFHQWVTE